MNAKYALALILTLQVSMSLCEVHEPSQALVDKYNTYRARFLNRMLNLYNNLHAVVTPLTVKYAETGRGEAVRDFVDELQTKPEFQAFVKLATGLGQEAAPLVDKARAMLLGLYEHHMRPHIGEQLGETLDQISSHLDKILPAD